MEKRKSIWTETSESAGRLRLSGKIKKDVIIVGGGMAGILTAYFLQQEGVDTAVLEANRIGSGQTGNTTAKITCQHGLIYSWMTARFGREAALQYAQRNQQAIEDYEEIIEKEQIDCDFQRLPSSLYTGKNPGALKEEEAAAKQLGILCSLQKETELPFPVAAALVFQNQAQFHPLKFLNNISSSMEVYEKTPVLKAEGNRLFTSGGQAEGKKLIFACHFPFLNRPGYYFLRMHQERSYVMALEHAQKLNAMYYGIDADFHWSFRRAGNLLLMGGAGHRTGHIPRQNPYEQIEHKAHEMWPEAAPAGSWSAQDCMTMDQIPYIGQFSRSTPDWYVASGFKKWGMTHSMASARLLTEQITGKERGGYSIFAPARLKLRVSLPFMLKDLAVSVKNLAIGFCGAAPKCAHLGCGLKWNLFEKTWECPCHGSGFNEEGHILHGPAQVGVDRGGR